jgi:hypothetical protein
MNVDVVRSNPCEASLRSVRRYPTVAWFWIARYRLGAWEAHV